jgi:ornithine decarboxylase
MQIDILSTPKWQDILARIQPLDTPLIVLDTEQITENIRRLRAVWQDVDVFYAIKSNPDDGIVEHMMAQNVGFEIASPQELETLLARGVATERIICMHTIKSPAFLAQMARTGITLLAADSREEVDKIAVHCPKAKILVRVAVPNTGSAWDLSEKFGISPQETLPLLRHIRTQGLATAGLTIHVGSQCTSLVTWQQAIGILRTLWEEATAEGITLQHLSLGGGIPVPYTHEVIGIEEIYTTIQDDLRALQALGCKTTIEPGRFLVGNAGHTIASIVGVVEREHSNWVFIDAGTYNGLPESVEIPEDQLYPITLAPMKSTCPSHPIKTYNIAGPTCAGIDVPFRHVALPVPCVGDKLIIHHTGAYTIGCSSPFNGFPVPHAVYYKG